MPFAGYEDFDDCVAKNQSKENPEAYCAEIQRKAEKSSAMFEVINDKLYVTARAYIVEEPQQLPREMASDFTMEKSNDSFVWIAGRYVQAENVNRNGHFWSFEDIKRGEASIRYTPVNAQHEWDRPIGTVVQTKIVQRETAAANVTTPEVQALSVVWGANFPELVTEIKKAHEEGTLFYSMECVAEAKQCMQCENTFEWAAAGAELCRHLASDYKAPRRFINPTFLGAALIFPPERPGWPDANITEIASLLTREYANRDSDAALWERLMDYIVTR